MKQLYKLIFILIISVNTLIANNNYGSLAVEKIKSGAFVLPTATITASVPAVCINGTKPVITFTGIGGTAPYTFIYTINNGADLTITTTSGDSKTLDVPTTSVGSFIYTLVSVKDSTGATQSQTSFTTVTVAPLPVIDFTFNNDNTCSGTLVQFTSTISTGTAPYTYLWDFGDGTTSTLENPTHAFNSTGCAIGSFTVKLKVTDAIGCASSVITKNVLVKQKPDISFKDNNSSFNPFSNCQNATVSNPNYVVSVGNTSVSASCIASYSIDWGDGTSTPNFTTFPQTHTYMQLGAFNMIVTALGTNGCSNSKTYVIKNVTNPSGGLVSPGSTTNLCAPTVNIDFGISAWGNNSIGTVYDIDYGDNSPIVHLTQSQLESSAQYNASNPSASGNYLIPHLYTTTSCPSNEFIVKLTVTNACGVTTATVSNITIYIKPVANFTVPANVCSNTSVLFTNTTISGFNQNCTQDSIYTWDFGDGSPEQQSIQNINHTYTTPGNYPVTLTAEGYCGKATKTMQICVEAPLVPVFTLNTTAGCGPLSVSTTNTTVTTNSCAPPTYLWTVTYAAANCGTAPSYTYTSGSSTSASPVFRFVNSGIYSISLTVTNSCGPVTSAIQTVTVKQPPTATINAIADFCGSTTITPTAVVNACAPLSSTLTYAWSFPGGIPASSTLANPGVISYSTSGNYTVSLIVTNECGNSILATEAFAINDVPVLTNTPLTQTICSGTSSTLVNLTSNPTGATYSWTATASPGITGYVSSGTSTIPVQTLVNSGTTSGTVTYAITPKIGTCNGVTTNYIITVIPAPKITSQPVSSSVCKDGILTPLSFVLSGVTGTPTYQWYSNATNSNVGGTLIPGETNVTYTPSTTTVGAFYYYCIISLPSGGCSSIKTNVAVIAISPLVTISAEPTPTQSLCVGATIASPLTVSYSGGTGTATYQWYSNVVNSNVGGILISGATSSSYTPPVFVAAGTTYFYAVVTLSGNGCGATASNPAEVIVFADPTISTQPIVSQTLCQGSAPQDLQVTAVGGTGAFLYQWYSNTINSNSGGTLISGATNAIYTPPTSVVGTVYYYCKISQSSAGCGVISTPAAVIVIAAPTIVNQPVSSTTCQNGTPTTLSVTYTNGVGTPTYQWYSNTSNLNSGGTLISGATSATYSPPALIVGTLYYYCVITLPSGGCSSISSNTATVSVTSGAIITTNPTPTQSLCVGATIASPLTVSYSGGTGTAAYQWYSNTANSNIGGTLITGAISSSYTPPVFTTAGTTYFYVVVTLSGSGCGPITSNPAEVIVVADPTISTQPIPSQTLCQGATAQDLQVIAAGGIGTFSYQWYSNVANSNTGGALISGATNAIYTPSTSSAGTRYYYCIISQTGFGCSVTTNTAAVIVNLAPTFSLQPISSTVCLGETPTLLKVTSINGVGTQQYQWYSNTVNSLIGSQLIPGASADNYNPPRTAVGTVYYYCVITFSTGGCSILTSNIAAVQVNQNPVIANKTAVICSSATFTISPDSSSGDIVPVGTTYSWPAPTIIPSNAVTGSHGGTGQNEISQTLINTTTSPATFTYTVIPTSGSCAGASFTVTVTVNPAVSSNSIVTNSTCFGSNTGFIQTNIIGGIPFSSGAPYLISWTGPNSFTSNAAVITNLEPGDYTLSITENGGCPFVKTYTITEPDAITLTTDFENDSTCFESDNGAIAISITGGTLNYTYAWTLNGAPFANTQNISNLSPGEYIVSVSDANNCVPVTATYTITEPPVLQLNLISQTNVLCFGTATGGITVDVAGGTPTQISPGIFDYNYAWTGPNNFTSSNKNLNAISAGTYNLIVTDNSGCTKNLSVIVTQSPEILMTATTTAINCYGDNNASIDVAVSGGVAPYNVLWNTLATGTFQDNLSAGDYVITVTDATNCQQTLNVNIPEVPIFTTQPVVKNISCFGAKDGSITLNLVGGIAPVSLVWSDGSTAGLTRNNLGPGTYTVTISDGKPCEIKKTFVILEPQPLVLTANVTNAFDCDNASSGAINLMVSGGSAPYTFAWSNGATTENLTNVPAGNYLITVTDANGCTKQEQYSINRQQPITIGIETKTLVDCDTRTVEQNFIAQVSGGFPPYSLVWSSGIVSGSMNEIMTTNQSGTIILGVTDALGCMANYSFNVEVPVFGNPSFSTNSYSYSTYGIYSIVDPIQFTNTATGGYSAIAWNFGDGTVSTEENPIHSYVNEGSYVVTQTVTYPLGCVYTYIVTLLIDKGYKLMIPNGFTPNLDGINENFKPVFKGLKTIQMDVYDTWGELIFTENGETLRGWDGKIKGKESENGNYYYKVKATTFYGTILNENGPFTLIK